VKPLQTDVNPQAAKGKTPESSPVWRLAFAGRMDHLKGGLLLLDTLPLVRAATGRRLHLVLAGDGPERNQWQAAAEKLSRAVPDLRIEFPGWLTDAPLGALFQASDLLTVPSVWPEPFGIVGVQAAREGVPAAAFGVGGIPEWLIDGVSGHLAPGNPPTAEGLARAIEQCLGNNEHYWNLSRNAAKIADRFTLKAHIAAVMPLLESAAFRSVA
jgi:glycosyltransferase involved in cell wall biosynthesis